jgi:hypothetical protein
VFGVQTPLPLLEPEPELLLVPELLELDPPLLLAEPELLPPELEPPPPELASLPDAIAASPPSTTSCNPHTLAHAVTRARGAVSSQAKRIFTTGLAR